MTSPFDIPLKDLRRLAAEAASEADMAARDHGIVPAGLLREEPEVIKTAAKVVRETSPKSKQRRTGRPKHSVAVVKRRIAR